MKKSGQLIAKIIKVFLSLTWYTTKSLLMVIWCVCTSIIPIAILFFEFARLFKSDAERLD